MKLSKKLTLSFIFSILLSIIIISTISNLMINKRFEHYLVEEQDNRLGRISDDLNDLYSENGYILYQNEINSYANMENVHIEIRDLNDLVIYSSNTKNNGKIGGMHKRFNRIHNVPNGNYTEKSFPLIDDYATVGKLIIGYIDNAYLTDSAIIFKNTLAKSLFISAIITVILGIATSMTLSKSLTAPLISITNTAVEIRKGYLNKKSNINTTTKEIVELSDSINFLGYTLAKQEDMRRKYASDISHELRTPLSTLKSHLEAIIDGIWEPSRDHFDILMLEIDRLSNLVDDLNESFGKENFQLILNKSEFNLSNDLTDIITTFTPLYNKAQLSISHNIVTDLLILMDRNKLKQIMTNILSNSIRYLNDHGEVSINLEKIDNNAIIKITDNGIGILEKDLPYIFDRFYRADSSRNENTGGSGLGLSIVKSIVDAHNGLIEIDSIYGKGTEITLTLPLNT